MRILYIDIDCLRPDHLGCYGYPRATSPNIDKVARRGLRFDNVYASDVPCLPSRTAFFSGRFGFHTGVVNHGGTQADPFVEGPSRGFNSMFGRTSLPRCLRDEGLYTATVSSFAERHGAYHFLAGFSEMQNPGKRGLETADEVAALAKGWLDRNATRDDWFLHVHFWDPHTPYRTPAAEGEPFVGQALPGWLTEQVRQRHFAGCGPHSAREVIGYDDRPPPGLAWDYPRQPLCLDSMTEVRRLVDGYDTGVLYADRMVGEILDRLAAAGVLADTVIAISADHGENLGELNVYGDHQTADQATTRVPFVLCFPGVTERLAGQAVPALYYQVDLAATLVGLAGGRVPDNWDGVDFSTEIAAGKPQGRSSLVLSQGAWTCQRGVRFREQGRELLYLRTYHDAFHGYPDCLLFDLGADPHEQMDLAPGEPTLCKRAEDILATWRTQMLATATHPADPLELVLADGGPKHTRGELPAYLERLRHTGRGMLADALAARYLP